LKKKLYGKQILLLDEVEMLWTKELREKTLSPIIKLNLPEFKKIIKHVWNSIKEGNLP
jgi:hypothetical protein